MPILVVDDTKDLTEMFCSACPLGHSARGVQSGREVLQAIEFGSGELDAIVLDYQMQGMDGIEVAPSIRQHQAGQRPAIILLTGHDGTELTDTAREAGIDRVAFKLLVPEQLASVIERILQAQSE